MRALLLLCLIIGSSLAYRADNLGEHAISSSASSLKFVELRAAEQNPCKNNGKLNDASACVCANGWSGAKCEIVSCPNPEACLPNGECQTDGKCKCNTGWMGHDCSNHLCSGCAKDHGVCVFNACFCLEGYMGTRCETKSCNPPCEGTKVCNKGTCELPSFFAKRQAMALSQRNKKAFRVESSPGASVTTGGAGAQSPESLALCGRGAGDLLECSGAGICRDGVCFCEPGHTGPHCSLALCPGDPECGGKGACFMGQCLCDSGFKGADCESKGTDSKTSNALKEDKAQQLGLEHEAEVVQAALRDVRQQLDESVSRLNQPGQENRSKAVMTDISALRKKALQLAADSGKITTKMDGIEARNRPSPNEKGKGLSNGQAAKMLVADAQSSARTKQLSYELFCNDKRQEVALALASNESLVGAAEAEGAFAQSIDAHLSAMWAGLGNHHRAEYRRAAQVALVLRDSTWGVAKRLFLGHINGPNKGGANTNTEALAGAWDKMDAATKARYFMAAQALSLGQDATPGAVVEGGVNMTMEALTEPTMKKAIAALTKSVNDLAFDLFADEKYDWAQTQVKALQSRSGLDTPRTATQVFADVEHLVANSFKNLSVAEQQTFVERAEKLLSSSYFMTAATGPAGSGAQGVGPGSSPLSRTLLTFTAQFLGLTSRNADRRTRAVIDAAVQSMLQAHLGGQVRMVEAEDAPAPDAAHKALARRYVVTLVNGKPSMVQKTIKVIQAGIEQGDLRRRLEKQGGLALVPLFPIGGGPELLTDEHISEWRCNMEADCSYHGSCEDGQCTCRLESKGGVLYEYGGYDCAYGPLAVCPRDCSFHGLCRPDGECACAEGYEGEACDVQKCTNGCSGHGVCFEGTCACEEPWSGGLDCSSKVDPKACADGCSGKGKCDAKGGCECDEGYSGPQCAGRKIPCPAPCANGGKCGDDGKCACSGPWKGPACETVTCEAGCHGHGRCVGDGQPGAKCECAAGYAGPTCECASDEGLGGGGECSGHGICQASDCYCHPDWSGRACSVRQCSPPDCSGHGACEAAGGGHCRCDDGWKGEGCGAATCLASCSAHGKCDGDVCVCSEGWAGPGCAVDESQCPGLCHKEQGRGECLQAAGGEGGEGRAACFCSAGFGGGGCEFKTCAQDCSGHGLCRYANSNSSALGGACVCEPGWFGESCDVQGCTAGKKPSEGVAGGEVGCSGHGDCAHVAGSAAPTQCTCVEGWVGGLCHKEATLEECALCCLNKCLADCHEENAFRSAETMGCYHKCQPQCVSRCEHGDDETCPLDTPSYAHLLADGNAEQAAQAQARALRKQERPAL